MCVCVWHLVAVGDELVGPDDLPGPPNPSQYPSQYPSQHPRGSNAAGEVSDRRGGARGGGGGEGEREIGETQRYNRERGTGRETERDRDWERN